MKFEERYTLQVPLGETARGTVWSARDERLKRAVVVAVVEADAPKGTATRFLHAWERMASARHPSLPRLIERGMTEEDAPFAAMEKVEGESLAVRLQDGPPLRLDQLTRALVEVADGLSSLHDKGGVHGDMEPSNVLLRERGGRLLAKVVGLGLGRAAVRNGKEALEDDEHLPTLSYMSPKQARGNDAGPADDAYSVAAILYAAMTGRLPHHGESEEALRAHIVTAPVPRIADVRPEIEGPLADVLDAALSADVSQRFADCVSLSKALRAGLLKSRGLSGLHTEVGERTLTPGPVVKKARSIAPPKPTVSLPRPSTAMRSKTSESRTGAAGPRPALAARPPEEPSTKNRTLQGWTAESNSEDLGFERLSGILEIPDLDEKAGPPPFDSSSQPSRPPPPPPQARRPVASKQPTLAPPPPPSPLGLQALGSLKASAETAGTDRQPGEASESARLQLAQRGATTKADEGRGEAKRSEDEQDAAAALPEAGSDTGASHAVVDASASAEQPDEAERAQASVAHDGDLADVQDPAADEVGADGAPAYDAAEDAGDDAADGEANAADDDAGDEADATEEEVLSADAAVGQPSGDVSGDETDDHGEESSTAGIAGAAGIEDTDDGESDAPPLLAGEAWSPDAPISAESLPLDRWMPLWVWGVAALALLAILVTGAVWLGGDDEAETVVAAGEPVSVAEPPTEPAVPDPVPELREPPVEVPEPPPEPVEEAPTLQLVGVPAGATVLLDGEPVQGDELTLDPDRSSQVLLVTLEGHAPFETELSGPLPEPLVVELEPLPAPVAEPPPRPAAARRGRRASGRRASGRRASGRRSTAGRAPTGRRRPVAVVDPGF